MRKDENTSAPPNESDDGGQAITGALTDPSVNPLNALLRPATVMYTFGRSSASYSFKTDNAWSGVLCADAIRRTVSKPNSLQASDIFVQCSKSALEPIKITTKGLDIMKSLLRF